MMRDMQITSNGGGVVGVEEIPVRVVITTGEDMDDGLVLSESINLDELAPPSFPPMPPMIGCSTSAKSSSSSSSSGSSSSSSSGSSGSSSSSSSDESGDETDTKDKSGETSANPTLNKTRIKARVGNGSPLSASKLVPNLAPPVLSMPIIPGKVVAAGNVVNDTIRVVPIKENTNKSLTSEGKGASKNLSNVKKLEIKKKEEKIDPTMRFKSVITSMNKSTSSTDTPANTNGTINHGLNGMGNQDDIKILPGSSTSKTKQGRQSQTRRSSRPNKSLKILDEKLSGFMQNRIVVEKPGDETFFGKKQKTKRKKLEDPQDPLTDPKFEVDGDAPKTFLRLSGKTRDWDNYLNTKNPENFKWIAPVSKFQNVSTV